MRRRRGERGRCCFKDSCFCELVLTPPKEGRRPRRRARRFSVSPWQTEWRARDNSRRWRVNTLKHWLIKKRSVRGGAPTGSPRRYRLFNHCVPVPSHSFTSSCSHRKLWTSSAFKKKMYSVSLLISKISAHFAEIIMPNKWPWTEKKNQCVECIKSPFTVSYPIQCGTV